MQCQFPLHLKLAVFCWLIATLSAKFPAFWNVSEEVVLVCSELGSRTVFIFLVFWIYWSVVFVCYVCYKRSEVGSPKTEVRKLISQPLFSNSLFAFKNVIIFLIICLQIFTSILVCYLVCNFFYFLFFFLYLKIQTSAFQLRSSVFCLPSALAIWF